MNATRRKARLSPTSKNEGFTGSLHGQVTIEGREVLYKWCKRRVRVDGEKRNVAAMKAATLARLEVGTVQSWNGGDWII